MTQKLEEDLNNESAAPRLNDVMGLSVAGCAAAWTPLWPLNALLAFNCLALVLKGSFLWTVSLS